MKTRRSFVHAAAASGIGLLVIQDAAAAQSPPASPVTTGGWSFTDDRGVTSTLSAAPTVIIAQTISAATLWDFGVKVSAIYGDVYLEDGVTPDPQLGNVDVSQVVSLGEWGEELDIEAAIELGAQLLIDVDRGGGLWGVDPETEKLVLAFAPTVAISTTVSTRQSTERFEDLAGSLGADLEAPELKAAKLAAEAAEQRLSEIAATKPGLKVLVMSGDPTTNAFFVNPEKAGGLQHFSSLGVDIVVPGNPDPAQLNVFETASWEAVGKYPADVILFDSRFDLDLLASDSLWNGLPAVKAGQVGTWDSVIPLSWQGLTASLDKLAKTIDQAEIVT